ncbi:tyrosine-type recombinase/integrase [Sphingomonas flavalba]|uniref:tyrosine-type recombinase/integrase n=1 Tax=Sphingomonas flavalba TaxID=2559804 RepID=UPI00109E1959|nr:hypothetical protein [Sphingomonas flavalba]
MFGVVQIAGKTEPISLQKGLSLYKQPLSKGKGSPNWYARVYLPIDGRDIHTKSTGTTDQKVAIKLAYEFYGECLVKAQIADGTLIPKGPASQSYVRFDRIADQWLDQLKSEVGDDPRKHRHWIDCKSAVLGRNGFTDFFGKDDIGGITTDRIRAFIQYKIAGGPAGKLAATTIKRNIVLLNVLLKYAWEKRLLNSVPPMPKVATKDNPRPWFDHDEYQRLHNAARGQAKAAKNAGDQKAADEWNELSDFMIFMVGSFLRPSEWPYLQHKHVKVVSDADNPHLVLTVIAGKRGVRKSVTMGTAIAPYRRIVARTGKAPESYVFQPEFLNRRTAQRRIADAFETLLQATDLKLDGFGNKRSTYSLRHTSLMLRFDKGQNIDILNLAKNAGTSVDQLERFYLKRINTADKIENLQSFRK